MVFDQIPASERGFWHGCLDGTFLDDRFHELVRETMSNQFDHRYLVFKDKEGRTRSIQPVFVVEQDLIIAMPAFIRTVMGWVRRLLPRFLVLRMLMVGSSMGEGSITVGQRRWLKWYIRHMEQVLPQVCRHLGTSLVILKDFPLNFRRQLNYFRQRGYVRMPSIPCSALDLPFKDFEDYMKQSLSHATRKNLRRKFRDADRIGRFDMEVLTDITPHIDEVYPLYEQVLRRASMQFEVLTKDYLCRLGKVFPERARFFIWRHEGRIVAFNACLVHEGILRDCYVGLEYPLAFDAHLYFLTIRDVFDWCMANDVHTYLSAPLSYEPKLHLHMRLVPHDVYVRHVSDMVNPVFTLFAPLMGPTRHDPILKKFKNYNEIL